MPNSIGEVRMKKVLMLCATALLSTSVSAVPTSTGHPELVGPKLLHWERDIVKTERADLTEPTSNRVWDLHSHTSSCDVGLSTSGNYHMALKDLWYGKFLPENKDIVKDWFYTTSPPVSYAHVKTGLLAIGNWETSCKPTVAVGPKKLMKKLKTANYIEGKPVPIIQNQGNVLLVKKGNPKNIQTIWDLGRKGVSVVTSNPYSEPGSFGNYSGSIYNIAKNDEKNAPDGLTADKLYKKIFNSKGKYWKSGYRIHHREVPWAVANGAADAGPMFYHLAVYAKKQFPELFDIVPLGGTIDSPVPLAGNKVGTMFIAKVKGDWNENQLKARDALIEGFQSEYFTEILKAHGLKRPKKPQSARVNYEHINFVLNTIYE